MKYLNIVLIFISLAVLNVAIAGIFETTHHFAIIAGIGLVSFPTGTVVGWGGVLSMQAGYGPKDTIGWTIAGVVLIACIVGTAVAAVLLPTMVLWLILGLT